MAIRYLFMTAACLSCLGCRAADRSNPRDPATLSAGDPPAARAQAQSTVGSTVVYAYYFHQTYRCLSCELMETTAAREIEEHFAPQIQDGQVVWMPVNIDKPEGKAFRQQFDVQGSALVLARMENGICKSSKKLDELWRLLNRPDGFSKYLVDEVNAYLIAGKMKP
jgi:hypothetical protein